MLFVLVSVTVSSYFCTIISFTRINLSWYDFTGFDLTDSFDLYLLNLSGHYELSGHDDLPLINCYLKLQILMSVRTWLTRGHLCVA